MERFCSPDNTKHSNGNWFIDEEERARHDALFYSLHPEGNLLSGGRARALFIKSKLNLQELSKIWKLADTTRDNMLDEREFATAMHLIQKRLCGYELPSRLPETLHLDPWPLIKVPRMSTQEKCAYEDLFSAADTKKEGYVRGEVAKELFNLSGISSTTLARIWNFSDVDRDGKITKDEFCVAMHAIRYCKESGSRLDGMIDYLSILPTEMHQESLQDKKKRLTEIQTEKRKLMSLTRKLRSEMENAEFNNAEAAILKIQSELDTANRDLDKLNITETDLRKEIISSNDDTSEAASKDLLAFDRSFLMRKRLSGYDLFYEGSKHSSLNSRTEWEDIPRDLFVNACFEERCRQLRRSDMTMDSTSASKTSQESIIITTGQQKNPSIKNENKNNSGQPELELIDGKVIITQQGSYQSKSKLDTENELRQHNKSNERLEDQHRLHTTKAEGQEDLDRRNLLEERSSILQTPRSSSGISPHLTKNYSTYDETRAGRREQLDTRRFVTSLKTGNSQTNKDFEQPKAPSSGGKIQHFSSNDCVTLSENSSVVDETELPIRRASLSLKRAWWLQQQPGSANKQQGEASIEGLPLSQKSWHEDISDRKLRTASEKHFDRISWEESQETRLNSNGVDEEATKHAEFAKCHQKESDMGTRKGNDQKIENEVLTVQVIAPSESKNDWFAKLDEIETLDSSNPTDSQEDCSSPTPVRRAKSEHDILSKNDEHRGSKRRKVLKTKSGHIVKKHSPGLTNLDDPEKISFVEQKNWLEGLVKTEIEEKKKRTSSSPVDAPKSPTCFEAHPPGGNENLEMYNTPRTFTLPRSETIDEESIRMDDRREWLGRLVELEISGRQEALKKMNRQKSIQVSQGSTRSTERRRSLPAGRLVEEYLLRQAVDIAPTYEQPGDFARQSKPDNMVMHEESSVVNSQMNTSLKSYNSTSNVGYGAGSYEEVGAHSAAYGYQYLESNQDGSRLSGIVKNNVFLAEDHLGDGKTKSQPLLSGRGKHQHKTSSMSSLVLSPVDRPVERLQLQTFPSFNSAVDKRNERTKALFLNQKHSLDSSLIDATKKGEQIVFPNQTLQKRSPTFETKSDPSVDIAETRQSQGIPSIRDKIAAFRHAETASSPELSQRSNRAEHSTTTRLQTTQSLDYKALDTMKANAVENQAITDLSENKVGKFNLHQNNTVVRRALDIASSDSNDKKSTQADHEGSREKPSKQEQLHSNDEGTNGINLARTGKQFWESMTKSNSHYEESGQNHKRSSSHSSGRHSQSYGDDLRESLVLAQNSMHSSDIGAAILGYDDDYRSYAGDQEMSLESSTTSGDFDLDEEELEYLKLVQDDRIKRELEEQNLREREMKRINRAKRLGGNGMLYGRAMEQQDGRIARRSPNMTMKPQDQQGFTPEAKRRYYDEHRGFEQRSPSKKGLDTSKESMLRKVDGLDRETKGVLRSSLLQREEEEERRRQMEFEEEKRQRVEERKKFEEEEQQRIKEMEEERKRKQEEEAERQRQLQEKKLEGRMKTHSLRALFEKVC